MLKTIHIVMNRIKNMNTFCKGGKSFALVYSLDTHKHAFYVRQVLINLLQSKKSVNFVGHE